MNYEMEIKEILERALESVKKDYFKACNDYEKFKYGGREKGLALLKERMLAKKEYLESEIKKLD